jgi:hypothetical protein
VASTWIKAAVVARQALGLLEREVVLPRLVTRDAGADFVGAQGDAVTIRVPAYMTARTRTLRGGTPITVDELNETSVTLTLDTDVYKAIGVSDEEMTLDIVSFGQQVTSPMMSAVARGVEDNLAATIVAAPFSTTIEVDNTDPFLSLLDASAALTKANVPYNGRTFLLGADLERKLLGSARFTAQIGGTSAAEGALRDATIGESIAGFRVVRSNAIDPDEGVAFHSTAFALAMRAPIVPDGASWGTNTSYNGLAMRLLRDYDFLNVRDRVLADVFIGSDYVPDVGIVDSEGRFAPDPAGVGSTITLATSAAADDIIDTATAHGFVEGQAVKFPTLTGGAGLTAGTTYYVVSTSLGAQTFRVAATPGGAAINFTTDITAGTTVKTGTFVRAVRLIDNA